MTLPEHADKNTNNGVSPVTIPSLANYPDPLEFKLALAAGGCYQLPVKPGTKNPGSILGKGWQFQSSRDPEQIRMWNRIYPGAATGIHTGRSGLTVIDLDLDEIPDELDWLRSGRFQSTRGLLRDFYTQTERGHYVFASETPFVSGPIKLADATLVGEVRSGNTIILSYPSEHPHAWTKGGEYRWITTGLVPGLPDEARNYLRPLRNGENPENTTHRENGYSAADYAVYLADRESSDEELEAWALAAFNDGSEDGTCDAIRNALWKWISAIDTEDASYPNLSLGVSGDSESRR